MRVSDASDASDALGNFFAPKKKIFFLPLYVLLKKKSGFIFSLNVL